MMCFLLVDRSREKRRTIDTVLEEKVLQLTYENKLLRDELYALKVLVGMQMI